jgi:hypothetical protein
MAKGAKRRNIPLSEINLRAIATRLRRFFRKAKEVSFGLKSSAKLSCSNLLVKT